MRPRRTHAAIAAPATDFAKRTRARTRAPRRSARWQNGSFDSLPFSFTVDRHREDLAIDGHGLPGVLLPCKPGSMTPGLVTKPFPQCRRSLLLLEQPDQRFRPLGFIPHGAECCCLPTRFP